MKNIVYLGAVLGILTASGLAIADQSISLNPGSSGKVRASYEGESIAFTCEGKKDERALCSVAFDSSAYRYYVTVDGKQATGHFATVEEALKVVAKFRDSQICQ